MIFSACPGPLVAQAPKRSVARSSCAERKANFPDSCFPITLPEGQSYHFAGPPMMAGSSSPWTLVSAGSASVTRG